MNTITALVTELTAPVTRTSKSTNKDYQEQEVVVREVTGSSRIRPISVKFKIFGRDITRLNLHVGDKVTGQLVCYVKKVTNNDGREVLVNEIDFTDLTVVGGAEYTSLGTVNPGPGYQEDNDGRPF